MKAITIHQPWATLKVIGAKEYETRGWKTNYRGPIAIHASMKDPKSIMRTLPEETQQMMLNCFYEHYGIRGCEKRIRTLHNLPTGAIIAIGELVNVWGIVYHPGTNVDIAKHIPVGAESLTTDKHDPHFGDYIIPCEQELALGDWTPGRYAWEIKITKILEQPYIIKGQQGLWNFDIAKLANQETMLPTLMSAT